MYFEIENTPEHIRKQRRAVPKPAPVKEQTPRLIVAPFSRPPQVVFENVLIGTSCERILEVVNPSKNVQQISLGRPPPPDLIICLPEEWLTLDPQSTFILTMKWTPYQPTAKRETIRFINDSKGRFDVNVVLKSTMSLKSKNNQSIGYKISPGKMKRKTGKKSPVAIYKKKAEIIFNATQSEKGAYVENLYTASDKENIPENVHGNYIQSKIGTCPFGSPSDLIINFDISETFSNTRKPNKIFELEQTYDKNYHSTVDIRLEVPQNVLRPSNRNDFENNADIFDTFTFTPLKSAPNKANKECNKVNISPNSVICLDDCLNPNFRQKENVTHTVLNMSPSTDPVQLRSEEIYTCTPGVINKNVPNTSSPNKEFNTPNFSIINDLSRISELSFHPPRFSTERKILPKPTSETYDIINDIDTYTVETALNPYPSMDYQVNIYNQPKLCRTSLFKECQVTSEYDKNYMAIPRYETNQWHNEHKIDARSPPRPISPPLQSIPEESAQYSEILDKTDIQKATFVINKTFVKNIDRDSLSRSVNQTWSKKSVRADTDLWKVPASLPKKRRQTKAPKNQNSISEKSINNTSYENNRTVNENLTLNHIPTVYSQSLTVDPFSSANYFYDEEAVNKLETEFKKWLNYVLKPPADLDSNIDQKIDIGKAWLENRNKEIPLAPTKEQVCIKYHDSHRLESLRKSARALLMGNDIVQVYVKLNCQIEKKLIAIRNDRNLHLDIGLQKTIIEILLSYNPLWLRIGLEAIYNLVIPLKSNSDIDGLTTFIVQRMFKNTFLKNKNSKSSVPNMLKPAYMEAIKKFTLKKFFMLVFFLDQAKQRKLIAHDPCLFCRNAICKESREIIIRFTRELIAGIGDITKHLSRLGLVVSHKQSYLDEYKYAVHNIAVDLRDGVRLTKVMEIILIKNNLLKLLRTPAISRLQKIHNVQVALNALNEADFVIEGGITATDIADGHREKTLSLLWQLIHVFRAPLFVKPAIVIQTWWRKKYAVIKAKRIEEQKIQQRRNYAASLIQYWWRRIQHNRYVEWKMQQVVSATIVIQKYFRMWYCKTRLLKIKTSVITIENWYRSIKLIRQAKETLQRLKLERDELRTKAAVKIQCFVRRWHCMRQYERTIRKIITIQSLVRRFLVRKWFVNLTKSVILIQNKYRGKLLMKKEMMKLAVKRRSAIKIQSYYRMIVERRKYNKTKAAVKIVEKYFKARIEMKKERNNFLKLKKSVILVQSLYRGRVARKILSQYKSAVIIVQRRFRANRLMKKEQSNFMKIKAATTVLQAQFRAYIEMKKERKRFIAKRNAALLIQMYLRAYLTGKEERKKFIEIRNSVITIQNYYRNILRMRTERKKYLALKEAATKIQRKFRATLLMRHHVKEYQLIEHSCILIQRRFRATAAMKIQRSRYLQTKKAVIDIQKAFRAYSCGKKQRQEYMNMKNAAKKIQEWYRRTKSTHIIKKQYEQSKQAVILIQRIYRAYLIGKEQRREYLRIKTAVVSIQKYYRLYVEMKTIREQFVQLKTATVKIQRFYRSQIEVRKQRMQYLQIRDACIKIQNYYRQYKQSTIIRKEYLKLRSAAICIQIIYRSIIIMKLERKKYITLKQSTIIIQQRYRALMAMKQERNSYLRLRTAALVFQRRYRAQILTREQKKRYITILTSCKIIQAYYRSFLKGKYERVRYLKLKQAALCLQTRYRALMESRKCRNDFLQLKIATIAVQKRYSAQKLMLLQKSQYIKTKQAVITIQRQYRAYILGRKSRQEYLKLRIATIIIQNYYRSIREYRFVRSRYLEMKKTAVLIQRTFRYKKCIREIKENNAARRIQVWYKSMKLRNDCQADYRRIRRSVVIIQSTFRMYLARKNFLATKVAALKIQRRYRAFKIGKTDRENYIRMKTSVIKLQAQFRSYIARSRYLKYLKAVATIQRAYRFKKHQELLKKQREIAAVCIQKYVRRYLVKTRYENYRQKVIFIQRLWRSKVEIKKYRQEYVKQINYIIKLQAAVKGYLTRKNVERQRAKLQQEREQAKVERAAAKIQALFRGNQVRNKEVDKQVAELRRRWREGVLHSTQATMRERHEEAMVVLGNMKCMEDVIRAFRSLKLLTEVFPMNYHSNATLVARQAFEYMTWTNRSISSVEMLKLAAAVLVNLARYKVTGPKIYARDYVAQVLKFMWRFSNSETGLFCILSTYLWLFKKYNKVRQDLTEYLHMADNHRMLHSIKNNVDRMKRMEKTKQSEKTARNKFATPQGSRLSINMSLMRDRELATHKMLPALDPDYGIRNENRPTYFEDASQAIDCLFWTYKLNN